MIRFTIQLLKVQFHCEETYERFLDFVFNCILEDALINFLGVILKRCQNAGFYVSGKTL